MEVLHRWDRFIEGQLQRFVLKALGSASTDFLEAYAAALEEVTLKVQSVGGRRLFPFKRVILRFAVSDSEQIDALSSVLCQRKQLVAEVRSKLQQVGCEDPVPLRVEGVVMNATERVFGGKPYDVLCAGALPAQPAMTVEVVRGRCERPTYVLADPTINIGRLAEVLDDRNRVIRRNHVAFSDDDEGISSTVSRVHGHIAFDQEVGWYRLFDDRSAFGSRFCRAGILLDVPPGALGGAWLRSGDEIHLGQARLKVTFQEE